MLLRSLPQQKLSLAEFDRERGDRSHLVGTTCNSLLAGCCASTAERGFEKLWLPVIFALSSAAVRQEAEGVERSRFAIKKKGISCI